MIEMRGAGITLQLPAGGAYSRRMKRLFVAGMVFAALLTRVMAAEEKFSSTVAPEELAATGLAGLTPAQLARIDALVDAYKSGALATARRAADEALVAKQVAEAKAARAEAKVEATKTEAAKSVVATGLLARTVGLLTPSGKKAEVEPIESSLVGSFEGWGPRLIFTLANGQRWQVANNESYYTSLRQNPRVQIVPASFGGFWLRFPDLGAEVRVIYLGEK
jgi:hypothetical protein